MEQGNSKGKKENKNSTDTVFRFILSFAAIFILFFSFFVVLGTVWPSSNTKNVATVVVPYVEDLSTESNVLEEETKKEAIEYVEPLHITIKSVGIDFQIMNPQSRDVSVLDRALMEGVVHYPGSGTLEEDTNMFLFGHSSHLPKVNNKSFQAFNNLEKVLVGDMIRVQSNDKEYLYEVKSISLTEADEALVSLSNPSGKKRLTLSTCNSFGAKTERYVVEAEFVGSVLLEKNS